MGRGCLAPFQWLTSDGFPVVARMIERIRMRTRLLSNLGILAVFVSALAPSVRAANVSWANAGGNVTNTSFWVGGSLPGSGDSVFITNNSVTATGTNDSSVTWGGLTLSNRLGNSAILLVTSTGVLTVTGTTTVGSRGVLQIDGAGVVTNGDLTLVLTAIASTSQGKVSFTGTGAKSLVVTGNFLNTASNTIDLASGTTGRGGSQLVFARDAAVTNKGIIKLAFSVQNNSNGNMLAVGGTNVLLNSGTLNFGHQANAISDQFTNYVVATLYNQGTVVVSNSAAGVGYGVPNANGSLVLVTRTGTTVTNASAGQWLLHGSSLTKSGSVFSVIQNGSFVNLGLLRYEENLGMVSTNVFGMGSSFGFTNTAGGQVVSDAGANFLRADAIYNAAGGTNQVNGGVLNLQGSSGGATVFGNAGALLMSGGSLAMNGIFTNTGSVRVANASALWRSNVVLGAGTYLSQGGTNVFSRGLTVASGASLIADATSVGAITGLVLNSGTVVLSNAYTVAGVNPWRSEGGNNQFASGLSVASDGRFEVSNGTSTVSGPVTNAGTISVVNANVTYGGPVVISGGYVSDPSTNVFSSNVTVTAAGYLQGGAGDLFQFERSLSLQSTNVGLFNLSSATVTFTNGVGAHVFSLAGSDAFNLGTNFSGIAAVVSNFAIGTLVLSPGDTLQLTGNPTNALYVGALDLGGLQYTNHLALDVDLYYDATLAANAWLGSNTFLLGSGSLLPYPGFLPIPEPSPFLALGTGLALLAFLRRRAA